MEYKGQDYVYILRATLCTLFGLTVHYRDTVQEAVDVIYKALLTSPLFNSAYFETFFATFCYTVIIAIYPRFVSSYSYFDAFKITPTVRHEKMSPSVICKEAVYYMTPLMALDTIIVKKYSGVEPAIWEEKQKDWIQLTRALPAEAPSIFQIFYQLVLSFLVYDILFFTVHFILHKNFFLYKHIHRHHHDHDHVHAHVTNQLSVTERLMLILSANFALKVFNSHPLTRTIFVPIFIGIIVDNHAGYDMPFGIHRLVPFGIVGGSPKHYEHHTNGKRAYQPILTYLDALVEAKERQFW